MLVIANEVNKERMMSDSSHSVSGIIHTNYSGAAVPLLIKVVP